jgi:hypothetical protein
MAESEAEAQAQLLFIKNFKRITPHKTIEEWANSHAQGL